MNGTTSTVFTEIAQVQGNKAAKRYIESSSMFNAVITSVLGRCSDDGSLLFIESSVFEDSKGKREPKEFTIKKVCKVDKRVITIKRGFTGRVAINRFLATFDGKAVLAGAQYKCTKRVLHNGHWVIWGVEFYKHICPVNNMRTECGYVIEDMDTFTPINRQVPMEYFNDDGGEMRVLPLVKIGE